MSVCSTLSTLKPPEANYQKKEEPSGIAPLPLLPLLYDEFRLVGASRCCCVGLGWEFSSSNLFGVRPSLYGRVNCVLLAACCLKLQCPMGPFRPPIFLLFFLSYHQHHQIDLFFLIFPFLVFLFTHHLLCYFHLLAAACFHY